MKLQVALDAITLEKAVELVKEARDYVDIIEIGTPMVIEYGMLAVRTMRENFPEKEILADLKIMDGGKYEAGQAFKAGADYITVLGVTDNLTVKACVEAANEYGKEVVVDMICVEDIPARVKKMEELGAHGVAVHVGVDQQASGRTPLDDLKVMKAAASVAKVSVAGGINVSTMPSYCALNPEVVIVGGGICNAKDPKEAAKALHEAIVKGA